MLSKFLRRIGHYRHNNVLKYQTFPWHNELIRAINISDKKTGNANNISFDCNFSHSPVHLPLPYCVLTDCAMNTTKIECQIFQVEDVSLEHGTTNLIREPECYRDKQGCCFCLTQLFTPNTKPVLVLVY